MEKRENNTIKFAKFNVYNRVNNLLLLFNIHIAPVFNSNDLTLLKLYNTKSSILKYRSLKIKYQQNLIPHCV